MTITHATLVGRAAERRAAAGLDLAARVGALEVAVAELRAERRAGEIIRDTEKAPAGRPSKNRSHDATNFGRKTLDELGISKTQSSRWQAIASVPESIDPAVLDAIGPGALARLFAQLQPYWQPSVAFLSDRRESLTGVRSAIARLRRKLTAAGLGDVAGRIEARGGFVRLRAEKSCDATPMQHDAR